MLSRLSQLHTKIYLNDLQFSASRSEIPTKARKQGYDKAVANMLTSPSTVRSVYIASTETVVFTFPERLAWNLVERLQLQCFVDLQSIYAILAQMPKLKDFRFSLSASYLFNLRKNAGDGKKEAIERCRKANNRVEFIDIAIRKYSAVPRINLDLVGVVREIIADPTNSLDWISPQLEVA
ncbi:hypothetical protein GGI12_004751 [Dipsacomyces acuminosporus]|nr:hypothetical protein GGI12_004751 [Dipsacomyces acuminosporus]